MRMTESYGREDSLSPLGKTETRNQQQQHNNANKAKFVVQFTVTRRWWWAPRYGSVHKQSGRTGGKFDSHGPCRIDFGSQFLQIPRPRSCCLVTHSPIENTNPDNQVNEDSSCW